MRAVGYKVPAQISEKDSLIDFEMEKSRPQDRDLLVKIRAVSVNPVDTKIRKGVTPGEGEWKVLGWDAAGYVAEVGPLVTGFKVGDEVYYAGDLNRPGTNAEYHLVDERIVARKPKSLSFSEAAALPLTTITAWEALFDRLGVSRTVPGAARSILIIGGAGGVGSIAVQLARQLTDLKVIATASRRETREWVSKLGAHHVVDHSSAMAPQFQAAGLDKPSFIFSTTQTEAHYPEIAELIAPQGRFALIDDPKELSVNALKRKSVSLHWEFMFTRSMFETEDIYMQGELLQKVAQLVDDGVIRTTLAESYGTICATNLKHAHAIIESGRARGKIVLEGFRHRYD